MQTQTQKDEKKTSPNGNPPPHTSAKATDTRPPVDELNKKEGEGIKREARKVYIVVGEIREFKNVAEAEKFVNTDPAAPKDFTVIKGNRVEKKQKVSFR